MEGEGSHHDIVSDTVQLKQVKSVEEVMKQGMDRAFENHNSVQFHEDSVS